MIRYTDPTYKLIVPLDLSGADVYVTIEQGSTQLTIADADVDYADEQSTIGFSLTQAQTAQFAQGNADVQVNYVIGGVRGATSIKRIPVGRNLLQEVI